MVRADDRSGALRRNVQTFVRTFGLLDDNRTPCGQPLPLSYAHALQILLERGDESAMQQKHLAEALALDKSSVARLCARMEQAGHVVQRRAEADGRGRALSLTAKGMRVAREVERASRARFDRLLSAIPGEQRRAVIDALGILNGAVASLEKEALP